ncbi:hypothetical protein FN846DRAFT_893859 [Sphaerosporella brunnea]|uniref:Uncharacterized protein n=1 Tax=Sphaerosporella brunnea TaxID=1250544 RepID=A0A5J5EKQ4_9PEZI|nr:hypothetical protein FN846DRAFT_893859 [Sphaerosporella brunnea]
MVVEGFEKRQRTLAARIKHYTAPMGIVQQQPLGDDDILVIIIETARNSGLFLGKSCYWAKPTGTFTELMDYIRKVLYLPDPLQTLYFTVKDELVSPTIQLRFLPRDDEDGGIYVVVSDKLPGTPETTVLEGTGRLLPGVAWVEGTDDTADYLYEPAQQWRWMLTTSNLDKGSRRVTVGVDKRRLKQKKLEFERKQKQNRMTTADGGSKELNAMKGGGNGTWGWGNDGFSVNSDGGH